MNPCRSFNTTMSSVVGGFAYLWLLFVVAFMGLGLSVGAEFYSTSQQRDKERELLAMGRQFRQAIARYYEAQPSSSSESQKQYPLSLDDLLADPRSPGAKRHLRKVFVDPMTGQSQWGLYKAGGRVVGVYSLSEKEPIKQDGFEADDASFRGKAKYSEWIFAHPADILATLGTATGLAGTGTLPASAPSSSQPAPAIPAKSPP
jgi:type II secretory pathway pseudopilin PulG